MTVTSKLLANGVFQTSVPLDEISQITVGQSLSNVYASEFDEISIYPITNGLAKRETSTDKFMVAGYFDEVAFSDNIVPETS